MYQQFVEVADGGMPDWLKKKSPEQRANYFKKFPKSKYNPNRDFSHTKKHYNAAGRTRESLQDVHEKHVKSGDAERARKALKMYKALQDITDNAYASGRMSPEQLWESLTEKVIKEKINHYNIEYQDTEMSISDKKEVLADIREHIEFLDAIRNELDTYEGDGNDRLGDFYLRNLEGEDQSAPEDAVPEGALNN
jgi:hypothetical protein